MFDTSVSESTSDWVQEMIDAQKVLFAEFERIRSHCTQRAKEIGQEYDDLVLQTFCSPANLDYIGFLCWDERNREN